MAEIEWSQRHKALNYHSDIVLRTSTFTSGENILLAGLKVPFDSFDSIMGIAYPEYGRIILVLRIYVGMLIETFWLSTMLVVLMGCLD